MTTHSRYSVLWQPWYMLAALMSVVSNAATPEPAQLGIINGEVASSEEAKSKVVLYHWGAWKPFLRPGQNETCGGSFIVPPGKTPIKWGLTDWVVTAAHCVATLNKQCRAGKPIDDPENIRVGIGINAGVLKLADYVVNVSAIYVSPEGTRSIQDMCSLNSSQRFIKSDYALLRLQRPVNGTLLALPNPSWSKTNLANKTVMTYGYSRTDETKIPNGTLFKTPLVALGDNDFLPLVKHVANLSNLPPEFMESYIASYVRDEMIGVRPTERCAYPYPGDSGGALTLKDTLFGVLSEGMVVRSPKEQCVETIFFQYTYLGDAAMQKFISDTMAGSHL